jgi:hypothetical protein
MVRVGDELWIAVDDELELLVCDRAGRRRRGVPVLAGALPEEPGARKAAKPDLEAIAVCPDGSVLVLGSGSRRSRRRGVRLAGGRVVPIDLAPLYLRLEDELAELNIEGAAMEGSLLRLLQRGNGAAGTNAVIEVDAGALLDGAGELAAAALRRVSLVALGDLDGVRLGFTDATPAGAGVLFSAAAEDSPDTYRDGRCAGSAIGLLTFEGDAVVRWMRRIGPEKIEGLTRWDDDLLLVSDADDRGRPAGLYRASWPS